MHHTARGGYSIKLNRSEVKQKCEENKSSCCYFSQIHSEATDTFLFWGGGGVGDWCATNQKVG